MQGALRRVARRARSATRSGPPASRMAAAVLTITGSGMAAHRRCATAARSRLRRAVQVARIEVHERGRHTGPETHTEEAGRRAHGDNPGTRHGADPEQFGICALAEHQVHAPVRHDQVAMAGRETRRPDLGNERRERVHVVEPTRSAAFCSRSTSGCGATRSCTAKRWTRNEDRSVRSGVECRAMVEHSASPFSPPRDDPFTGGERE